MTAGTSFEIVDDRSLKLPVEVAAAVFEAQKKTAKAIRKDIRHNAPQKERNRIGKTATVVAGESRTTGEQVVEVGLKGYWSYLGPWFEFGTVKMAKRPFVQPAADAQRELNIARIAEATNRATEG